MMVLYCCLFNIIHHNSTFNPNSITFTLYYYLREQKTPTRPLTFTPLRMEACGRAERRGGSV